MLGPLAQKRLVHVFLQHHHARRKPTRTLESRTATSAKKPRRLPAGGRRRAGGRDGCADLYRGLNDNEIPTILAAARARGWARSDGRICFI